MQIIQICYVCEVINAMILYMYIYLCLCILRKGILFLPLHYIKKSYQEKKRKKQTFNQFSFIVSDDILDNLFQQI